MAGRAGAGIDVSGVTPIDTDKVGKSANVRRSPSSPEGTGMAWTWLGLRWARHQVPGPDLGPCPPARLDKEIAIKFVIAVFKKGLTTAIAAPGNTNSH